MAEEVAEEVAEVEEAAEAAEAKRAKPQLLPVRPKVHASHVASYAPPRASASDDDNGDDNKGAIIGGAIAGAIIVVAGGAVLVCWMTKSCCFDRRPAPQAQMTAMTGMRSTVSVSSGTPVAAAASSVPVVTGTPVAAAAVSVASGMPVHVKVPHGTHEARLIRIEYNGSIGPASINARRYTFVAKGIGPVAYTDMRDISAFIFFNDDTRQSGVLKTVSKPAPPAPAKPAG